MKYLITLSFVFAIIFNSQAKRFDIEFINSQENMCVVYLDDSFIGKMMKGESLSIKLKKGKHQLSFVVFKPNGEFFTYLRDIEVDGTPHQFLLLANTEGYIHLEKYEGVNPLVLKAICHLPLFSRDDFNLLILKLNNIGFENYRFELIKREMVLHRFTTHELQVLLEYVQPHDMKVEIAHIAYQHLIDKHNYHNILFELDETSVKKLERNAEVVNRYL